MPTSATRKARARPRPAGGAVPARVRGFTLLELLIVIVLIAVIMAVTVAGMGGRGGDAASAEEAQRLAALIELARDRAESSAEEWGLDVEQAGYAFLVFEPRTQRWRAAQDERFRERALPDELRLEVEVDAREVQGEDGERGRSLLDVPAGDRAATGLGGGRRGDDERVPDILLLSSGEASQFVLRVGPPRAPELAWTLQTDGLSMVRASATGEDMVRASAPGEDMVRASAPGQVK